MEEKEPLPVQEISEQKLKRRTFLAFTMFTLASAGGIGLWQAFRNLPQKTARLAAPTRKVLEFNEQANALLFSEKHLAPTYPVTAAVRNPRVNGKLGLAKDFEPETWQLQINIPNKNPLNSITLNDIKQLPKTEIVFDFKCIEGWNEIVHYGGVTFADFLKFYGLGTLSGKTVALNQPADWYSYVGLETPDRKYYVGLDMPSVLHPQTLLCYEMNGQPLTLKHGAPLRLIIPTKYGVKNLKRIGTIFFSETPPRDYWYEQGYIYDAAL